MKSISAKMCREEADAQVSASNEIYVLTNRIARHLSPIISLFDTCYAYTVLLD